MLLLCAHKTTRAFWHAKITPSLLKAAMKLRIEFPALLIPQWLRSDYSGSLYTGEQNSLAYQLCRKQSRGDVSGVAGNFHWRTVLHLQHTAQSKVIWMWDIGIFEVSHKASLASSVLPDAVHLRAERCSYGWYCRGPYAKSFALERNPAVQYCNLLSIRCAKSQIYFGESWGLLWDQGALSHNLEEPPYCCKTHNYETMQIFDSQACSTDSLTKANKSSCIMNVSCKASLTPLHPANYVKCHGLYCNFLHLLVHHRRQLLEYRSLQMPIHFSKCYTGSNPKPKA